MCNFGLFLTSLAVVIVSVRQVHADCERARSLLGAEDVCWSRKVEIIDRLQYTQKRIMNFAKKKLGMDVDKEEPQKCEYYYCIFTEMKLINPDYDVPCLERTSNWAKRNTLYNDGEILLDRVEKCSDELKYSLNSNINFLADNVDKPKNEKLRTSEGQSKCEISLEYMKCLANPSKITECPVFQFP
ncbi:uncharacterized protein [Diabrotica undecimpunctata]|uniref:uncharacterized protein n=1 Tax=Diabrotica undecimpunctata TaxID=50387 RepID=UPI003B63522C